MKRILFFAALTAIFSAPAENLSFRRPVLVPAPVELTFEESVAVRLSSALRFEVTCPDVAAKDWVVRHVKTWFGFEPSVVQTPSACEAARGDEGYLLSAKPERIFIGARTLQGVRYALYTLRQAAERESVGRTLKGYWLPALEVKDSPALAFRGVHFCWFPELSKTLIEHQIRTAAYYKFNYVVLESWGMFRSRRHPQLALRDSPLTPDEAGRLAALARDLGVTLIPQVNIYGHATGARGMGGKHATLDYHPEMQPLFEPAGGWNWCLSNPDATAVVREYVDEMHEAFGRPPFFHVGCDEADEASCPRCRAVKPYAKLVGDHLLAVHDMLKARGARIMMWHDMLLEKDDPRWKPFYARARKENAGLIDRLPRDIVICDWYYGKNYGRESKPSAYPTLDYFKAQGFSTLTCPWDDVLGVDAQGAYARKAGLFGMLETIWHHFRGSQFASMMMRSAYAAWGVSAKGGGEWTSPFAVHWRQTGWDMGISDYDETGFIRHTVTRDALDR